MFLCHYERVNCFINVKSEGAFLHRAYKIFGLLVGLAILVPYAASEGATLAVHGFAHEADRRSSSDGAPCACLGG